MIDVPRETAEKLKEFADAVAVENERQNLIARSTIESIDVRHIADSLQLLSYAPEGGTHWVDIGTGAGFPGLAVALADPRWEMTLVEPRPLRTAFLQAMVERFALADRVSVVTGKIEHVQGQADVISARAVAKLGRLFEMASHLAHPQTRWLLPKGRQAAAEVAEARTAWTGLIRLEQSETDPDASIVVAERVERKDRGR
ncbi:MAG: 16S rRNA (guanine(527)-N(7))-methyltransferase RsmG [Sphingomonas fennica]